MASQRFARLFKIVFSPESETPPLKGRAERWLHFWVLVVRLFVRNRCQVRAEALSYSSLLALIPLLAVALGVTSSLLKHEDEERFYQVVDHFVSAVTPPAVLDTNAVAGETNGAEESKVTGTNQDHAGISVAIPGQTNPTADGMTATNGGWALTVTNGGWSLTATNAPLPLTATNGTAVAPPAKAPNTAQKEIARQIRGFVQHTNSGTLGLTGMIVLLLAAMLMLRSVEATFNDIWGVTEGRHWLQQVFVFCGVMMLGPLLAGMALGLAGEGHLHWAKAMITHMPLVGGLLFKLLPLVLLWLTFALIYWSVPNTRVTFGAAFIGGLAGGSLWQLNNLFGFLFVSRVATNLTIYGSLGLVPVLMIGLYLSWCILLFGAQVAYVFQNRQAYWQDRLAGNVNQRGREFVALRLMAAIGRRFQEGGLPATAAGLSASLRLPERLTGTVLPILVQARLVTEVAGPEPGFVPARPLEDINVYDILQALRTANGKELPADEAGELETIYGEFARVERAEREAASGITLLSLVERISGDLRGAAPALLKAPEPATEKMIVAETLAAVSPVVEVSTEEAERPRPPGPVQPSEHDFPL